MATTTGAVSAVAPRAPDHLRICAWLHVVSGLAVMLLLSFTLATLASRYGTSAVPDHVKSLLGSAGIVLGTALCIVAGVELVGGVAVLAGRPIGRPLLLLSAAFHVINVPLGTALAVYTFWALSRRRPPLP